MRFAFVTAIVFLCLIIACRNSDSGGDADASVPKGDPQFPAMGTSRIIDHEQMLSDSVVAFSDQVLRKLKTDGIAEVVIVVINGVKQQELWAAHYGRRLGMGKDTPGNHSIVWLICPDARLKLTISIDTSRTKLTSDDYVPMMKQTAMLLNSGNYSEGVLTLTRSTDSVLRHVYGGN